MKYKFIDELNQPPVDEEELRYNLFALILSSMKNSYSKYRSKEFDYKLQFDDMNIALNGTVEEVLKCITLYYGCIVEIVD